MVERAEKAEAGKADNPVRESGKQAAENFHQEVYTQADNGASTAGAANAGGADKDGSSGGKEKLPGICIDPRPEEMGGGHGGASHSSEKMNQWLKPSGDLPSLKIDIDSRSDAHKRGVADSAPAGDSSKKAESPEMERVGKDADHLAQLMKDNASPEEQQKAWKEFEDSTKGVSGRDAQQRLQQALDKQHMGTVVAERNDYTGKMSVVDYGMYGTLDRSKYDDSNVKYNMDAEKNPDAIKAVQEFADTLQKGVSSEQLKQMMTDLNDKLAKAGLLSLQASVLIDQTLDHLPNNKYSEFGDQGPLFMVDGKPTHLWTSNVGGEMLLNYSPAGKKLFG
jgi:hypothetical protein